jgi:hypothetical protein
MLLRGNSHSPKSFPPLVEMDFTLAIFWNPKEPWITDVWILV